MTGAIPIVATPRLASTEASGTSSSAQGQSLSELGPNAFITLLTAQLQAQDPLNPMDPNQMVSELTSMNTLQETIQIRQDLDKLTAAIQGSSGNGGAGSPASSSSAISAPTANPTSMAASALSSGLAVLTRSLEPNSISNLYSPANNKSQLF